MNWRELLLEIELHLREVLPNCPFCRTEANYKISGRFTKTVECRKCHAKWILTKKNQALILVKNPEIVVLDKMFEEKYVKPLLRKTFEINFWRRFGEFVSKSIDAAKKGLRVCPNCHKEIPLTAFACKYCGEKIVDIKDYIVGKMCPFAVVSVGGGETTIAGGFGGGEYTYTWKHMICIQEYCALWDFENDKCGLLTKR